MTSSAAVYDLTNAISPYLDLHMMFPLLEYVDSLITTKAIPYSAQDVAKARLSLLRPTHMVDYAMDIYRELHGTDCEIPAEMEQQKEDVLQKLEDQKADNGCKTFEDLCNNHESRLSLFHEGSVITTTTRYCDTAVLLLLLLLLSLYFTDLRSLIIFLLLSPKDQTCPGTGMEHHSSLPKEGTRNHPTGH